MDRQKLQRRFRWGGLLLLSVLGVLGAVFIGAAGATSACVGAPTLSSDGTTIHGSFCSDYIVVTSPKVREVVGGEGNDVIYVNPDVVKVFGGAGNDVIYGELPATEHGANGEAEGAVPSRVYHRLTRARRSATATASTVCPTNPCFGGVGSQNLFGGAGNDQIFGQRGNDELHGEGGNDALYGGIGDDRAFGNEGNDLVTGELGSDALDGNNGSDLVRGDGTTDMLFDTGGLGTDTVSFASGVAPGFTGAANYTGFPAEGTNEERGVSVHLDGTACTGYAACNNAARYGGGNDQIEAAAFENVIGTPFSDLIIASSAANRIDGGGGADVILGEGGDDTLYGGADGDYLEGGNGTDTVFGGAGTNNCVAETANECSGTEAAVTQRDRSKIEAGVMVPSLPSNLSWSEAYVVGSNTAEGNNHDDVTTSYSGGHLIFTAEAGSAEFDTSSTAQSGACTYEATKVDCTMPASVDAVLLAGMQGSDELTVSGSGLTEITSPMLIGGEGGDTLYGSGTTEDTLIDGPGSGGDSLFAFGFDDALMNNEGKDRLEGGNGNDLLVSAAICEGDTLQGATSTENDGSAQNSASFAQYTASGVIADLAAKSAGNASGPSCTIGTKETATLGNIDDLEGTNLGDELYGDGNPNNLLGRPGKDGIFGRAGSDNLEAQDGEADTVGGGADSDSCPHDGIDTVTSCP
jgi:Ca2+-binding RTX toxin-like protein